MRELLVSGAYYVKKDEKELDRTYWGDDAVINDPDGKIRNLLDEKEINSRVQNYRYIINYINNIKPQAVLDLGCGLGDMLISLDRTKIRTGVDSDIKFAQKRSKEINWIDANVEEYSSNLNLYDVIICHHVIEHLREPVQFIQKIFKLMKEDSLFIIATPDFDCGLARLFDKNFRMLKDPTHCSLFSFESLSRLLKDTGFILVDTDFPYFETTYFTEENLLKTLNLDNLSPPFYGNWVTYFVKKPKK